LETLSIFVTFKERGYYCNYLLIDDEEDDEEEGLVEDLRENFGCQK
jgi:hypothetical protein